MTMVGVFMKDDFLTFAEVDEYQVVDEEYSPIAHCDSGDNYKPISLDFLNEIVADEYPDDLEDQWFEDEYDDDFDDEYYSAPEDDEFDRLAEANDRVESDLLNETHMRELNSWRSYPWQPPNTVNKEKVIENQAELLAKVREDENIEGKEVVYGSGISKLGSYLPLVFVIIGCVALFYYLKRRKA